MSTTDQSNWEAFLMRVAAGEASSDSDQARALLQGHPERLEELEDLLAIQRQLDTDGAEERAVRARAKLEDAAPGLSDVAPTIRRLAKDSGDPMQLSEPARRWPLALVGLITSIAAVGLLYFGTGRDHKALTREPAPILLGSALGLQDATDFTTLQWQYEQATPSTVYRLRVWNADSAADSAPVVDQDYLEETNYSPTPTELDAMGRNIRWEVTASGSDGRTLARQSATASRP